MKHHVEAASDDFPLMDQVGQVGNVTTDLYESFVNQVGSSL